MLQWFAGSEQLWPAQGRGGERCFCLLYHRSRTKHGEVSPLAQLPSLCSPTCCFHIVHLQQRHNERHCAESSTAFLRVQTKPLFLLSLKENSCLGAYKIV